LEVETRIEDGVSIVKLNGRLSMGAPLDRFNAVMSELVRESHIRIVLDLEGVPTLDSSAIGMLVRYLTTTKQRGGAIRLFRPSPFTVQALKVVGLLNLFPLYDDLPQAVASFQ
jgi:anti-sigma B factor antagonist